MKLVFLMLIVFVGNSVMYIIGYASGYNRGYEAGRCEALPWKDSVDCWMKMYRQDVPETKL
jgi:hypothetical protein